MEIKFPKHKKSFKKGGMHNSPGFFWNLLLLVAFLIIISSAILGFSLFRKIFKDPVFDVEDSESAQIVNKDRIDKVLGYFFEREETSKQIRDFPSPVIDPSL